MDLSLHSWFLLGILSININIIFLPASASPLDEVTLHQGQSVNGLFNISTTSPMQTISIGEFLGDGTMVRLSLISSKDSQSSISVTLIRETELYVIKLDPDEYSSNVFAFHGCCKDIPASTSLIIEFQSLLHLSASGEFAITPWPLKDIPKSDLYFRMPNPGTLWVKTFSVLLAGIIPAGVSVIIMSKIYRKLHENY